MMMWFVGSLIVLMGLCYVAKVVQETRDAKEEKNQPVAVQPISAGVSAVPSVVPASQDDDEELSAVISAAIAAVSGTSVQILNIQSGSKAWVLAGRQDLMSEF